MKVLIVSQYFWPENFKINDIANGLVERGFDVSVLTGKPNYPEGNFHKGYSFLNKNKETWNSIKVYRSPLIVRGKGSGFKLFLNYISFAFFASLRVLFIKNKFDKILVYEPSPMTVGLPAIIAKYKFKIPIYFWVQDLWPESISAAGGIKNKQLLSAVNYLTKFIYNHCEIILVQSKAFIPYVINQNINIKKIKYLPNSTEKFYKPVDLNNIYKKLIPNGTNLMFAGNIGEAQSFETIIKTSYYLNKKGIAINWIILGDGRQKNIVKKRIKSLGIEKLFYFLGSYPSEEMPKFFAHADALLVTLKKTPIFAMTIPNKIQSYMACSKPIIASLDGEGRKVILESKCGYVVPSEDHISLAKTIIKFLELSEKEKEIMGLNGRNFFEKEFEREKQLDKLIKIFNER
jgi:colanic acid biosynthesis glycosyl transferase WcaI